jgi:hypothetical protein
MCLVASVFSQRFETRGQAPSRPSFAPFVAPGLSLQLDLTEGYYAALQARAETHFLSLTPGKNAPVSFAMRTGLSLGKYF